MIFVIVVNQIVQKNTAIVTEEVKLVDQNVIVLIVTTVRGIQMVIKIQILNQRREQNFKNDLFIFFDSITVKIS